MSTTSGPYNYSYIFKYIIIGDMGVGKSCLLHQFTDKKCTLLLPTKQPAAVPTNRIFSFSFHQLWPIALIRKYTQPIYCLSVQCNLIFQLQYRR